MKLRETIGAALNRGRQYDSPGEINAVVKFDDPPYPVNLPSYADRKEERTWVCYRDEGEVRYLLKSDPGVNNMFEAAILRGLGDGVAKHPDVTIRYNELKRNVNLLEVSGRIFDGSLNNVLAGKEYFRDTARYRDMYLGTPEACRLAVFYYSPATLLFGGFGSQGQIDKRNLTRPPKITGLVEGIIMATGRAAGPTDDPLGDVGLRRGSGSLMPILAVKDVKGGDSKSSEDGTNFVPCNANSTNYRGATLVKDVVFHTTMPLGRVLSLRVGDDDKQNTAVQMYLVSLWLAAFRIQMADFDLRRGCHLSNPKAAVTLADQSIPMDKDKIFAFHAECHAAVAGLLCQKREVWTADKGYDKRVWDSNFKDRKKKPDADTGEGQ